MPEGIGVCLDVVMLFMCKYAVLTLPTSCAQVDMRSCVQAAHLASLVEPHMLRRFLRDLRSPQQRQQLPVAEVQLQIDLTPQQAEACKTLLVRNFEILADPKPPRCVTFSPGLLQLQDCSVLAMRQYSW